MNFSHSKLENEIYSSLEKKRGDNLLSAKEANNAELSEKRE